jgi:site-specific DNA-methyltransferase (adenine-specific)
LEELSLNKIYNENCLETMGRMTDEFVDLVVTSPIYDNLRKYNGYVFEFKPIARELFRIIKTGGVVVWIVGDETINGDETGTSFEQVLFFKKIGFKLYDTMIYKKLGTVVQNPVKRYSQDFEYIFVLSKGFPKTINIRCGRPTGKRIKKIKRNKHNEHTFYRGTYNEGTAPLSNVWEYSVGIHSTNDQVAFEHPAIFPEKLAADHIYSWSKEDDLIYDPFGGSGTTGKMAHLQKRNWIMSEISEEYCKIAEKRLKPYLQQLHLAI